MHSAATHGLFSGDAVATLSEAPLTSLAVADTVEDVADRCAPLRCEHAVIASADLFAEALAHADR